MAVPWVHLTENALVPKIMLQFPNGDTSRHQGDSAAISMYRTAVFEQFVKKILCPHATPMCSDPLVVPFRQNSPNVGHIPSPYYMNKTTTWPHSCISHRRAAAHRRAGGKRALRLLIFRFWVDFEEIYLYFVPPRGPARGTGPSISSDCSFNDKEREN